MARLSILLALLLGVAYCGEPGEGTWQTAADAASGDTASDEPCGGHGSLHGGHCHCEEGWAPVHDTCKQIGDLPECGAATPAGASCRCEPSSHECACPAETESEAHLGAYYCAEHLE